MGLFRKLNKRGLKSLRYK